MPPLICLWTLEWSSRSKHHSARRKLQLGTRLPTSHSKIVEHVNTWKRRCNNCNCSSENAKRFTWVTNQRSHYSLHLKGETSLITLPRIQALDSLGFDWGSRSTAWEVRLSELADYREKALADHGARQGQIMHRYLQKCLKSKVAKQDREEL